MHGFKEGFMEERHLNSTPMGRVWVGWKPTAENRDGIEAGPISSRHQMPGAEVATLSWWRVERAFGKEWFPCLKEAFAGFFP